MFVRFNYGATLHYVEGNASKTVCGQPLVKRDKYGLTRPVDTHTNWNTRNLLRGNYYTGCMLCDHCAKRLPIDVRGMIK
jgi:hypothetical protein